MSLIDYKIFKYLILVTGVEELLVPNTWGRIHKKNDLVMIDNPRNINLSNLQKLDSSSC